ncbi:MAG: hypothetical protein AAFW60_04765 [Pseudomonadota bacterium]
MSYLHLFEILIVTHIIFGAPGLISFWVPVASKKGATLHKAWGKAFVLMMLVTATCAVGMATLTILDPVATHPKLMEHPEFSDPDLIRGIFGWMMLYLAILTINLTWYGWLCIRNRGAHAKNRAWHNMLLQLVLLIASANCAWQGLQIEQPMMIGISLVGFATVGTNLWFMLRAEIGPLEWLTEHIKALVGTGISVYTAFLAFGAVRLLPELALAPVLWAIPLITGLTLILYHQRQVTRPLRLARSTRPT